MSNSVGHRLNFGRFGDMKLACIAIASVTFAVTNATATPRVEEHDYDHLERLCRTVHVDGSQTDYFYDANGNRTSVVVTAAGDAPPSNPNCQRAPGSPGVVD